MIIRHEPPDAAFSFTVQAPLLLQTGPDAFVELREWNSDGFLAPKDWPADGTGGTLTIPFQGIFVSFNLTLPGATPGEFVPFAGLNGRQQELLRHFHHAIVVGRMSSVDGVIRSIDRPVDLVPMMETEEEGGRVPARPNRRTGQTIRALVLYGGLAVLLWSAIWSHAWESLTSLPLQSGRYETYNAGAALATGSGWIDHRHAISVFVGMDATMSLNVGGEIYDLPAIVVDVFADREPEGRAKSGYIVEVVASTRSIAPDAGPAVPGPQGGPADIRLYAPLFPSLGSPFGGAAGPTELAGGEPSGIGLARAN